MKAGLMLTLVIAALVGSAATLLTERWMERAQKLATVDPGILVAEHLQELDPGMDESILESRSRAFAARLEAAIAQVAEEHRVVILVKPAVVAGAPDLTSEIRRRIDERTR